MEHEFLFVRHGQGSFFAGDYDRLTPQGERQASILGDYWCSQKKRYDAVFVGPRRRQQKTAELVGQGYRDAGLPWPDPQVLPELDEFHFQDLLDILLPKMTAEDDRDLQAWHRFRQAQTRQEALEAFAPLFEKLVMAWISGGLQDPRVESWADFSRRVLQGLDLILERCSGTPCCAAIFTSGGTISVVLQQALNIPDRRTLPLAWGLRNTAFCGLRWAKGEFHLQSYNETPHLPSPEWITYI